MVRSAILLLAVGAVWPAQPAALAQAAGADARLAEARQLLGAGEEKDVRRGAELCREIGGAEAIGYLLEVLGRRLPAPGQGLPAEHYRDVVWDALTAIRDVYDRRRVEQELANNKDDELVRQWCAELLGIYGDADFGRTLLGALDDKVDAVRRAAARSLGQVRWPGAVKALEKLLRHKDEVLRANALEALARIDPAARRDVLFEAARRDRDGGVRCALLGAAHEIYAGEAEELARAALADDDWRPRMQAVENLGDTRTKTAVDALIGSLADGRPVVARRAVRSLQELTGEKHRTADQWSRWWAEHRETFMFPEGLQPAHDPDEGRSTAQYNGIQLVSDHVAFLIDKSAKMSEPLKSRGTSKDQAALQELEAVLGTIDSAGGRLVFNVYTYELRVRELDDEPQALTTKSRKEALEFVRSGALSGSKNVWAVLERVLDDPEIDTAYLLSSGEPDVGLYVHWNRVTWHLRERNRFRKLVVHSIAYNDYQGYRDQLEKISAATGGEFRWFE